MDDLREAAQAVIVAADAIENDDTEVSHDYGSLGDACPACAHSEALNDALDAAIERLRIALAGL